MKSIVAGVAAFVLLGSGSASGLTITFDNTAPTGDAVGYNQAPVSFGAFTFTATGDTEQFSLDPEYETDNAPPNGTDFETFEGDEESSVTWTMSSATPFRLTSFRAAAIYDDPAGTLTVTGNLSGGGTVVQVFNIPSGNPTAQWATYALNSGFANLASVDFEYSNVFIGLDDVVVDGAGAGAGVPVPTLSESGLAALMLALVAASAFALRRR